MAEVGVRLQAELTAHAARFMTTLPDFRHGGGAYLLVSLRSFDGAIRRVNGTECLLLGVDEIARVHGADAQLTVLFDHELFHIYHGQVFPEWAVEPSPLWHALWAEGLATYASAVLNPQVMVGAILGQPSDLEVRARPILARLAWELYGKLDSVEKRDHADFFYGGIERADVPPRSGYYVGLLVARSLAQAHRLPKQHDGDAMSYADALPGS